MQFFSYSSATGIEDEGAWWWTASRMDSEDAACLLNSDLLRADWYSGGCA
jgi:hypothetical protein